jgi:hypothetical protein
MNQAPMTAFKEISNELRPILTQWIERTFPSPIKIEPSLDISKAALYLYVALNDGTRSLPAASIGREQWGIWYVGQSGGFPKRHWQHGQQIGTCKENKLLNLLAAHNRVTQIDLKSAEVKAAFEGRRKRHPADKHNFVNCKNSIGWSAVTHVTWIDAAHVDKELRVRTEEILIGILRPPLNWL